MHRASCIPMRFSSDVFGIILSFIPECSSTCNQTCHSWQELIPNTLLLHLSTEAAFLLLIDRLIQQCGHFNFVKRYAALLVYGLLTEIEIVDILTTHRTECLPQEYSILGIQDQIRTLTDHLAQTVDICGAPDVLIPKNHVLVSLFDRVFCLTTYSHWNPQFTARKGLQPAGHQTEGLAFQTKNNNTDIAIGTMMIGRAVRRGVHWSDTENSGHLIYIRAQNNDGSFGVTLGGATEFIRDFRFDESACSSGGWVFGDGNIRCSYCTTVKSKEHRLKSCPCKRTQYCSGSGSKCQTAHWKKEHKHHHKNALTILQHRNKSKQESGGSITTTAATATAATTATAADVFFQIPLSFSPQVIVHMLLKNHSRVGSVHQFFSSFGQTIPVSHDNGNTHATTRMCDKDSFAKHVESIQAGIFQTGINTAASKQHRLQLFSPLPLSFAATLMNANMDMKQADTFLKTIRVLTNSFSNPSTEHTFLEQLWTSHGLLEVAEFHLRSRAGYTNEHGIVVSDGDDTMDIFMKVVKKLLDSVVEAYNEDKRHAYNNEIVQLPMDEWLEWINALVSRGKDNVVRRMELNTSSSSFNEIDIQVLALFARTAQQQSFLAWNTGQQLRGVHYAMQAIQSWEMVYSFYFRDGKNIGATLAPQTIQAIFGCADSFAKLGLNLIDSKQQWNNSRSSSRSSLMLSLPEQILRVGLAYLDILLATGSVKQKKQHETKTQQLRARTLNDMARISHLNQTKAYEISMKALTLRTKYFGVRTLPSAQSNLNVGSVLMKLQKPIKALPFLALALSIRLELLQMGDKFLNNAMHTYAFGLYSIAVNQRNLLNGQGQETITDEDVQRIRNVVRIVHTGMPTREDLNDVLRCGSEMYEKYQDLEDVGM